MEERKKIRKGKRIFDFRFILKTNPLAVINHVSIKMYGMKFNGAVNEIVRLR